MANLSPEAFSARRNHLESLHRKLVEQPNRVDASWTNGIYERYVDPVVTPEHVPLTWRYDLQRETNPHLLERMGVNATFNAGAIEWNGRIVVCLRVEGWDRKSFFAMAESQSGVDGFRFWEEPCQIPETSDPDTNVYDMRLTRHEDGWIYGTFCTERRDPKAPESDQSAAVAQAGIVRTRDLNDL